MDKTDKKKDEKSLLSKALEDYIRLLQTRPVITKAITNAVVSAFGNVVSQFIAPDQTTGGKLNLRSIFAYSSFGFLVNGPLIHHFYVYLEKVFPKNSPGGSLKRVLFDRFIFAPPFLLVFLYYVSIVEGAGQAAAAKKIKDTYWTLLKLNWSIWTFVQYFNINYVPLKFRTLFGNCCALIWMVFISVKRRQWSK